MKFAIVLFRGVMTPVSCAADPHRAPELTRRDRQLMDRKKLAREVIARSHLADVSVVSGVVPNALKSMAPLAAGCTLIRPGPST